MGKSKLVIQEMVEGQGVILTRSQDWGELGKRDCMYSRGFQGPKAGCMGVGNGGSEEEAELTIISSPRWNGWPVEQPTLITIQESP